MLESFVVSHLEDWQSNLNKRPYDLQDRIYYLVVLPIFYVYNSQCVEIRPRSNCSGLNNSSRERWNVAWYISIVNHRFFANLTYEWIYLNVWWTHSTYQLFKTLRLTLRANLNCDNNPYIYPTLILRYFK